MLYKSLSDSRIIGRLICMNGVSCVMTQALVKTKLKHSCQIAGRHRETACKNGQGMKRISLGCLAWDHSFYILYLYLQIPDLVYFRLGQANKNNSECNDPFRAMKMSFG